MSRFLFLLAVLCASASFAAEGEVVLDGIDFDGGSGISREFLESMIGIPAGKPLSREKLDLEIEGARRRLDALAFFRTIDMRLVKGAVRDHYRLAVVLGAARVVYQGASLTSVRARKENEVLSDTSMLAEAFVGSRALFGTSLRGELAVFRNEERSEEKSSSHTNGHVVGRASLYEPAIFGTPWFAGVNLLYSGGQSTSDAQYDEGPDYHGESTSYMRVAHLTLGRRVGLLSGSATWMRGMSDYRYESRGFGKENGHAYFTYWIVNARYSDKPFISRVEPGLVASVQYMRGYAPEVQPPLATVNAARTWMVGPHALTPTGIYDLSYMMSCYNDDCRTDLRRSYDLSATYEFVFLGTTVLGFTYGEEKAVDVSDFDQDDPKRFRWKVALGATYSGTQIDLAFVYGDPGLDRTMVRYFFPDHARFTQ